MTGPLTVQLKLKQPFSPLTAQLADRAGMILSPTQIDKLGDSFASNPVCVGPFIFDDRVAGDRITVVKSPDYYDKEKVHLDKIVFSVMTDPRPRRRRTCARATSRCVDRLAATDIAGVRKTRA